MRIAIYPDTNAFFNDRFLRKRYSIEFLEVLRGGDAQLYLSPVVVAETLRQSREAATALTKEFKRALRQSTLASAVDSSAVSDAAMPYVSAVIAEAEEALRDLIDHPATTVLEAPYVATEELLERDLARRRPFLDKKVGSIGFRDAIIWSNILEHIDATTEDHVLIITGDGGFLDSSRKALHSDLMEDLDAYGIEVARIHVATDLQQAKIVLQRLRELIGVREATLSSAAIAFAQMLARAPWGSTSQDSVYNQHIDALPSWLNRPTVLRVDDIEVISVGDGEWSHCRLSANAVLHGQVAPVALRGPLEWDSVAEIVTQDEEEPSFDVTITRPISVEVELHYEPLSDTADVHDYEVRFVDAPEHQRDTDESSSG